MKRTFTCYSDPGHGWVKVPAETILAIGLKAADFTPYSYVDHGHMFLEEDCDASKFVSAFEKKFNTAPRFTGKHCNGQSRVRHKHNNCPEAVRYFIPELA